MCPLSYGLGSKFNQTVSSLRSRTVHQCLISKQYFSEFESAINYITEKKGAYAILDPHNYMRYNDPSQQPMTGSVIGNTSDVKAATTAQFGKFWGELARRFKKNEKVIFGLMNEVRTQNSKLKPN